MLHTLSTSPWHADTATMLRLIKEGDDLLLMSDGVVAAVAGSRFLEILQSAPITIHALQEDIEARGLGGQIADGVVRLSYTDFVRLTVKHPGQLAW
ncbi:sulfurtransferase complex subunit TusB [Klebsiella huaxiensis]|uniref:sulfurtransferase complex subunit TusB n=1 Tax=Klebsiella huaxiensis TaxID=2153354 RepID=UPI00316A8A09